MLYVHERMAELFTMRKSRKLTKNEEMEMSHCLQINADYCFKVAAIQNKSLFAFETNDFSWQHEICAELEELELKYTNIKKASAQR